MKYFCCDLRRLKVIKLLAPSVNGIDYLEVRDRLEPVPALRQRTLYLRLLRPVPRLADGGSALGPPNILIDGGARVAAIGVEWVAAADHLPPEADPGLADGIADPARTLVLRTAAYGDFSRYRLHLRASAGSEMAPDGFDPRLSHIDFSFKVECPADFDCLQEQPCPPERPGTPDIDYLAKDYTGFRRLMLERMNLLVPGWRERSAADLGVALVELMAYAADNLSYRQDAIAAEAYLGTARRRASVRRHARLVDYALHDGCNARAWVHLRVAADHTLPKGTAMLTRSERLPPLLAPDSVDLRNAIGAGATVFETAHAATLLAAHNRFAFYTWGELGCCLPYGATSATLRGHYPDLRPGDVLLFQEMLSPTTFEAADADPARRWAVRLVAVGANADPSGHLFDELLAEPAPAEPLALTEIAWDGADALPFPLCLSVADRPELRISVALGNIVLVDHGRTIAGEALGTVPASHMMRAPAAPHAQACARAARAPIAVRFRPALANAPVTEGFDLARELAIARAGDADPGALASPDQGWFPATALMARDPQQALPQLYLQGRAAAGAAPSPWTVRRDLLASGPFSRDVVLETENDGAAFLRFGDDTHGERPNEETQFSATYRVGNGTPGNVGAQAIYHIVSDAVGVFDEVSNPMPAAGGIDPEEIAAARRDAPQAFRTQERAVTAADYGAAAERRPDIQRAAATFRWTGSWHTVFVTADRVGGAAVDARFEARLRQHLERFRMAGYDLEADGARYVSLDIVLRLCVLPDYFRADVLRAVQLELGSGVLPDGSRALFHPDNFTFAQPVYLSPIVAAAQAVAGVESVTMIRFERLGRPDTMALRAGVLHMGRLEIAQLANNPNFRERGRLTLYAGGGK